MFFEPKPRFFFFLSVRLVNIGRAGTGKVNCEKSFLRENLEYSDTVPKYWIEMNENIFIAIARNEKEREILFS